MMIFVFGVIAFSTSEARSAKSSSIFVSTVTGVPYAM